MNFKVGNVEIGLDKPMFVIAGPCVLWTESEAINTAMRLLEISKQTGVPIIFKASYDKANRSEVSSYRGPGLNEGVRILNQVKKKTGLPVTTDVSDYGHLIAVSCVVDLIQIPAFLSRQTDLIRCAATTGLPVNVKKGQFMAPPEVSGVQTKMDKEQNSQLMITERGTTFGYQNLVVDMASVHHIRNVERIPVVFDATHSIEGRDKEISPVLAKAAVAAGANGLFFETLLNPWDSKCDAGCIYPLDDLRELILECKKIFEVVNRD